jgi:hypothetical protein
MGLMVSGKVHHSMSAFDQLADDPRWVGWANEERGADKKLTKVPYGAGGKPAKANDPETWVTRDEALRIADQVANGHGGGIGIELGDVGNDIHLIGFDLDSCIETADGKRSISDWAKEILVAAATYAERSPSGNGLKLFAYIASDDVRPFLDLIGVEPTAWGTRRSIHGHNGADHGPAIEVYCAKRYFAVTDNQLKSSPARLALLDWGTLEKIARLTPAPRNTNGVGSEGRAAGDNSRSAAAFREGGRLRREGKTFEEMCSALHTHPDPDIRSWTRAKGAAWGGRELRRIWEKTANALDENAAQSGVSLDDFYAYGQCTATSTCHHARCGQQPALMPASLQSAYPCSMTGANRKLLRQTYGSIKTSPWNR